MQTKKKKKKRKKRKRKEEKRNQEREEEEKKEKGRKHHDSYLGLTFLKILGLTCSRTLGLLRCLFGLLCPFVLLLCDGGRDRDEYAVSKPVRNENGRRKGKHRDSYLGLTLLILPLGPPLLQYGLRIHIGR
jgi:hypothetical protein